MKEIERKSVHEVANAVSESAVLGVLRKIHNPGKKNARLIPQMPGK
jgi:hypothetical protein